MTSRRWFWRQDSLAPTPHHRRGSPLPDATWASAAQTLPTTWKQTLRIKSQKRAALGAIQRREAGDEDTSQGLGDLHWIPAHMQALGLQRSPVLTDPRVFFPENEGICTLAQLHECLGQRGPHLSPGQHPHHAGGSIYIA